MTVLAGSERFGAYEAYDRGVHVVHLASRRNPYWPANPVPMHTLEALEIAVARERPDIIHAHDALPFLLQLTRARGRFTAPVMATCHYYPSFVASYLADAEMTQEMVERIAWRYTIGLYDRVDEVVFATRTHRDSFRRHGLTSSTHVISNGVDTRRYSPAVPPLDLTLRYGVPDGPRVLAVGRLAQDKDLEVLIGAMATLRQQVPARLLLVGEGPHREALESAAHEAGVASSVHFLGFVPEDDLPALYRACDAFAISSNHEVQSLPALQAAATGLPIVAADQGALHEICRDGENGILVNTESPAEWAAALRAVLEPDVKDRMGQAGLLLAQEHDEHATFARYEALYRQSLSLKPGPDRSEVAPRQETAPAAR